MSSSLLAQLPPARQFTDPIDRLRDPLAASGYHGVECHNDRFRAREPFSKRPMPVRHTAREAAADLLHWWYLHFGPDWPRFHAARHCPAWRLDKCADGHLRLVVYVRGVEVALAPVFENRAQARNYLRKWTRRFGADAWRAVRRAG